MWMAGDSSGVDPNLFPLGAIAASQKLLQSRNLNINQVDLVEINEAFSVKVLAFLKYFNCQKEKVNIYGGALAYGHPYGASGAIIMLHLMEALKNQNKKIGLTTLGVAGGLGEAAIIERCN